MEVHGHLEGKAVRTIYKYQLSPFPGPQTILMPTDAKILHVDDQNGVICLWALIDTNTLAVTRWFQVVGTGYDAADLTDHIGTVMQLEGALVLHVFEVHLR